MKRTKLLIAVLLILAASLILTGCPREPEEEIDPAADAGTWNTATLARDKSKDASYSANHRPDYFSSDKTTQIISFNFDYSEDRNAAKYTDNDNNVHDYYASSQQGTFKSFDFNPYFDSCIGFEVSIKKTSGEEASGYGVAFLFGNSTTGNGRTYYELFLCDDSYVLEYYDGTNLTYLTDWVESPYIKPLGQENVVKVATRNDGKIGIYINGELEGTLTPPDGSAVKGLVFPLGGIGYADVTEPTASDVNITWKFNKLQMQQQ